VGGKGPETPMQWMWIEDGEEIRSVSIAGCLGTWPNIAEIEGRLEGKHTRCQKIRETSKPSASLPK